MKLKWENGFPKTKKFILLTESGVSEGCINQDGEVCKLVDSSWIPLKEKFLWCKIPYLDFDTLVSYKRERNQRDSAIFCSLTFILIVLLLLICITINYIGG